MTPNGTNVNSFFHRKIERREKLCLIHKNSRLVLGFITRNQYPLCYFTKPINISIPLPITLYMSPLIRYKIHTARAINCFVFNPK